jgi:hypothetical protein
VRGTCYYPPVDLPRFGNARTSDDDHFFLGTLSIDEELIIRNRGGHVKVRGQSCPVTFKCLPLYVPLGVGSDQEVADAYWRDRATRMQLRLHRAYLESGP